MLRKYRYLTQLPHGDNWLAVPMSGLFTEIMDRRKAASQSGIVTPESRLPIGNKHKEASSRITTCLGYLSSISYRLLNSEDELFMNKQLDFENLIIYSQILLDSYSVLVPLFHCVPEKYLTKCSCKQSDCEYGVNSFNNLSLWFEYHSIKDKLANRYSLIKKNGGWYKTINQDRTDFVHTFKTPIVISKKAVAEAGFKMKKDKMFRLRDVKDSWAKTTTIEKEMLRVIRGLLDFTVFSTYFFADKLKKNNIYISSGSQFKCNLLGDFKYFNKKIFN